MAELIPFPAKHRVAQVRKMAAQMAGTNREAAERLLAARLARHQANLEGKGIDSASAKGDALSFESAVRTELWRLIMRPSGDRSI
jgi:hypothetical protein